MTGKIALIIPNNRWFCPFVEIYIELLEGHNIPYDIISWNREEKESLNVLAYKKKIGSGVLSKIIGYYKFSRFVISSVKKTKYIGLVVFTSQVGIFCASYLKRRYKGKYIFDFRDLSIEQNWVFKYPFRRLLSNSFANVISSPGFERYLPSGFDYYLSHNFKISEVEAGLGMEYSKPDDLCIDVLTIGGIRDYEANVQVIEALGGKKGFKVRFVGKGPAAKSLEDYSHNKGYDNVEFQGYYKKEQESGFVSTCTFMNIFYPDVITHKTALSNRFYNSLIYKKPMIVTQGQIQGDFCEKYNLGVTVPDTKNLAEKLKNWLNATDYKQYQINCVTLLKTFMEDYKKWKEMFFTFILS